MRKYNIFFEKNTYKNDKKWGSTSFFVVLH